MAIRKREIIISAIVVLSLAVIFFLNSAKVITHSLGTTICNTFLYFVICYLYINLISATKWRILFAVSSLSVITVVISAYFYLRPRRWEFESRVIICTDCVAMVAFLLITCTQNRTSTLLITSIMTEVVLLFFNRADSEESSQIFTVVVSIIVYVILSTFYVKKLWDQTWKVAAIASIFVFTILVGLILRFYWYDKKILFAVIASINTFMCLVPLLWKMCSPKLDVWWQLYHEQEMIDGEQYSFYEMTGLPTRFTIKELERATENFQAPIGEGASGAVFKGSLADGTVVAVKRIKWQPNGENEFRTEMAIIASRQHVNLVRLLGFCLSTRGDRYLVYPFLENGSLDAWIFTDDIKRSHLTWAIRFRIAIDVAKALAYLHHECHHRILHLDIKPANILLDGKFRALLSDFGISKLIGKDETSVMTRARGTVIITYNSHCLILILQNVF
jgi:Protein kinase domain